MKHKISVKNDIVFLYHTIKKFSHKFTLQTINYKQKNRAFNKIVQFLL